MEEKNTFRTSTEDKIHKIKPRNIEKTGRKINWKTLWDTNRRFDMKVQNQKYAKLPLF